MYFDESGQIEVEEQRIYGGLSFDEDTPYFEVYYHFASGKSDDWLNDPLFSIVFSEQHTKLYFCNNRGSDYIELADYPLQKFDSQACRDYANQLISEAEVIEKLMPTYRFGVDFIASKLASLRSF